MGKIATHGEICIKLGLSQPPFATKCATRDSLTYAHNWVGPSDYPSNRLVELSMVEKYTPPVSDYTLTFNISNMYSAVALFTTSGTPSSSSFSYELLKSNGPNVYTVDFAPGAGIGVNIPNSPGSQTTIYSGQYYSVWGQFSGGSFWTLIATLRHVDGDKTEYI